MIRTFICQAGRANTVSPRNLLMALDKQNAQRALGEKPVMQGRCGDTVRGCGLKNERTKTSDGFL